VIRKIPDAIAAGKLLIVMVKFEASGSLLA